MKTFGKWFRSCGFVGLVCAAFAAGCAVDVVESDEGEDVGENAAPLMNGETTPTCKPGEQLCCPRGGPACSCIPEKNTCSSGFLTGVKAVSAQP